MASAPSFASCHRKSLELARNHPIASIAFPAISTGSTGCPPREAADTAIATIAAESRPTRRPDRVILCTYDALATMITTEAFEAFAQGLRVALTSVRRPQDAASSSRRHGLAGFHFTARK